MQPDVLLLDGIGGGYTEATLQQRGLGGSEIEILQVARGLAGLGYTVTVANGVDALTAEGGITYVPHAQAWQHGPRKALYLQRWNSPESRMELSSAVRIVVRANDNYCPQYDVHRPYLTTGRGALVANTRWQAESYAWATERAVIPPMLEPMPQVDKVPGLFVFASGAQKGFEATAELWCALKAKHPRQMAKAELVCIAPGWGEVRPFTEVETRAGLRRAGSPTPDAYRRWIARAEGLFMVNTMIEVFCCAAALAERAGTRTHILAVNGVGGLVESVQDKTYITTDPEEFEQRFIDALKQPLPVGKKDLPDWRPETVIHQWADVLRLNGSKPITVESTFKADPSLAKNQEPLGPFFGDFLSLLRGAIAPGGSEFGAGLTLFSLAVAIKAREIVEIGRFKGFSTVALAAACRLLEMGWTEPKAAEQRPDVEYRDARPSRVLSIDPAPTAEAADLLTRAGVERFVTCQNDRSDTVMIDRPIDLLLIDGGHAPAEVRADVQKFVPWVRPGGYFILHDYFGWFQNGQNGSPIAKVIAEALTTCDRVLIDTSYASLVLFRKAQNLTERWELDPKPEKIARRADGRPTVGLCLIAKGDEVSTVATRAITSAKKAGVDCVTVVCDAQDAAAEVSRALGADVFIRPTPAIDWANGIGTIAGARNDALAIAERRTDYVLMLDADDYFDGELPKTLDRDAYEVTISDGGLAYRRVQLFRSALGWRYSGIIHETLIMGGSGAVGHLETLRYRRGQSSYAHQNQDPPPVKYAKHAHLAQKWLLDHPDDTRAQFYLARSYHDAGMVDEAITAYEKRIAMTGGWEEERSYSSYQIGHLLANQGKDPTLAWIRAHEIGEPKAEPLVALARWYRDDRRRQFSMAYAFAIRAAAISQPQSGLFLEPWIYLFEAAAEVAIAAYWLGQKQEALQRFEELLPRVPQERRKWAEEQIALCLRETSR